MIGSFFVPQLSDKYGRKKIFTACMSIQLFIFVVTLVLPSNLYILQVASLLVLGVSTSGRTSIGFCYFCEFSPTNYHNLLGTLWSVSEAMVFIYLTIYYKYISKDWFWTVAFGLSLNIVGLVFLLFLPESPRYLFYKKRFKECEEVLRAMAKYNGRPDVEIEFYSQINQVSVLTTGDEQEAEGP